MPYDANPERIGPFKVDVTGYQSVRRSRRVKKLQILFTILYSPSEFFGSWILSVDRTSLS
jgi:hypothetical protein